MRLLKFNSENVDIDEQTAIGIDFQAYDVKEPGSRRFAASNNFTIPLTANNLKILGFAGNPQSISKDVYSPITCEYWNQNKKIINSGTARITEISERISVFVVEKPTCWESMQDFIWPTFQSELITWLQTYKGLPSASAQFTGSFADFISLYTTSTTGVILPFYISNFALYDPAGGTAYIEDINSIYLKYNRTISGSEIFGIGGHFCVYCKTIFEFIEYKYGVDLSVTDTSDAFNIFMDAVAAAMYVPIRNLSIQHTLTGFYFLYDATSKFFPTEITKDKEDKSLYDFVKIFFQYFNCLIDRVPTLDNSEQYIIHRFDNITSAPVIDLSGKFTGTPVFTPTIENYKQNNWIKFSGIYENGNPLLNSKKIICKNKNIEAGASTESLFDINAYIPSGYIAGGDVVLDLSPGDTFKQFPFFVTVGSASTAVKSMQEGAEVTYTTTLRVAKVYALTNEYNTLASMVEYPVFYSIKRWITLHELDTLVFFAKYFVKELNGYFFLNKIESYNPEKSTEATTIELIKIP